MRFLDGCFGIWMWFMWFFRLCYFFSFNLFCIGLFILCLWRWLDLLSTFLIVFFLFITLTCRFGFSHRLFNLYNARLIFFFHIYWFNIDLLCTSLFCLLCLFFRVIFFRWLIILIFRILFLVFLLDFLVLRRMNLSFSNMLSIFLFFFFWSFHLLMSNIKIHIISNFTEYLIIVIKNITD